ncbi:MAG: DUF3575 domain-containing protein [Prevotellaceae bacterium]|jgi:hypothetical protein|nr:DUF3575 domain-containing protein [Prevotellaceae bacterium]
MKKGANYFLAIMLTFSVAGTLAAQNENPSKRLHAMDVPRWAIKTNLLYDATTTINLGTEFSVGRRYTLDLSGNYNPWTYSHSRKVKHFMVQPELRYWLCESFYGHFLAVHGIYAHYNVGGVSNPFGFFPALKRYRYQGNLYGGGVAYGYHQILSPRWSLEYEVGVGYIYTKYNKFACERCGELKDKQSKGYFTPTKVAVSLIYIIK